MGVGVGLGVGVGVGLGVGDGVGPRPMAARGESVCVVGNTVARKLHVPTKITTINTRIMMNRERCFISYPYFFTNNYLSNIHEI